jgi:hypothetical protein
MRVIVEPEDWRAVGSRGYTVRADVRTPFTAPVRKQCNACDAYRSGVFSIDASEIDLFRRVANQLAMDCSLRQSLGARVLDVD